MNEKLLTLGAAQRWDNYTSCSSSPLDAIQGAARMLEARLSRVEIPRRIWMVIIVHPDVMPRLDPLRDKPIRIQLGSFKIEWPRRRDAERAFEDALDLPSGGLRIAGDVVRVGDGKEWVEIRGVLYEEK